MATIAPSRHVALSLGAADGQELTEALGSWRRRLWIQQMLRWTEIGVIVGIILACLLLLISRITPWAAAIYWAIGVATASLLCASGAAIWYRPSFARSAHVVDARLALHDRLSTAWELRNNSAPISVLQRRDALKQLGKHTPAAAIPLWPRRMRLITFGAVVIALALLLLLPNQMDTVLQQQAAFQNQLARQVAAINQIRQEIDNQAAISAQERNQIDKILREAMSQLQQAKNGAQAQQVLAQAQAKLNQLRDPQATSKALARAAASSSLAKSSNANLSAAGKALATGDNKGLDSALQKLASQISSLTSVQRAQLAQQIEQSANQALDNPALSSALHQLAKAVADGSPGEISDAINAVETAAAQDSANQATTSSIDQASQSLQNAANTLASSTDNSNSQNSGQAQTPGQGQNPGQGQTPSQGESMNGSGGQNNAGNKLGKNEQVYVPGQVGSGSSTISSNGDNGTVQSGSPVPYSQVIAQYQQMAHDAIDNSSIPPDLKDLIQGYYDSLEGHQ
jgi:RNase P protein component